VILSFDIECNSGDGKFPQATRDDDKVIQIGMTYSYLGDTECFKKVVLCLGDTSDIKGSDVICYNTEKELLLGFTKRIRIDDPDIITGYNIFGFDFEYLKERAKKFKIYQQFSRLSRVKNQVCEYVEQTLSSSALGRNNLKYYNTPGRVCIDLMKVIQRDYKLNGYKLDNVSATFIRGNITDFKIKKNTNITNLIVDSSFGLKEGDFITIYYNMGLTDNKIGEKYKIIEKGDNFITVEGIVDLTNQFNHNKCSVHWCQAKDDVSPKDIFRLYRGDADEKAIVAKYCLKDCSLCNRLMAKLQILPNSIGMGNVCCVPLSYLFLRGQSIKIFSLVAKQCREENYLIPTMKKKWKPVEENKKTEMENKNRFQNFAQSLINRDEDTDEDKANQGLQGATVFEPVKGVHYDPIIVDDYGSLYPSSMIEKNLSHNSIVLDPKYDNLPNYIYHVQTYNNNDGTVTTCRFAERSDGKKATIPRILEKLLSERKKCKKILKMEKDPFKKSIWDGLQLAYKVTANSLYGQCGSPVSPIVMIAIAACTTAIGRDMLILAKDFVENEMTDIINLIINCTESNDYKKYLEFMRHYYKNVPNSRVKKTENSLILYDGKEEYYMWVCKKIYNLIGSYNINPQCIYGDTDSVFFKLNMTDRKTGEPFREQKALEVSIKVGILTSEIVNYTLDAPQVLEYEKVYWPFVIISKKRYVGNLYELDPTKFKQKSMGLVTKRRDNADIVKDVVGGIISQILDHRSPIGAVNFTKQQLMKIITGKYNIEKFIITKTLKDKDAYKEWSRIAHAVLANRMGIREPGNKPQSNDRLPYVYVVNRICIINKCNNKPIYNYSNEVEPHYCDIHKDKKMIPIINKKKLQGERIEHPVYLVENNLKIDFLFYITNQIMKPALQFLELIVFNPEKIFKMYIIREENRKAGINPIMKYYNNCPSDKGNSISVSVNGLTGDDLFGKQKPKTHIKRIQRSRKTKRFI
jgi:DNA polymerase elongation subunit (family B)